MEGCTISEPQRILDTFNEGKLVVAIPANYSRSRKVSNLSIILNEVSKRVAVGGSFESSGRKAAWKLT